MEISLKKLESGASISVFDPIMSIMYLYIVLINEMKWDATRPSFINDEWRSIFVSSDHMTFSHDPNFRRAAHVLTLTGELSVKCMILNHYAAVLY